MKKTRAILIIGILTIMFLAGMNTSTACCGGRWTGGGTIGTYQDQRVTHGFELHCNKNQLPNNLQVNWGGNHFHLKELDLAYCGYDSEIDPEHPLTECNWIEGSGYGKLNGVSDRLIEFHFTDDGEPGTGDWAWIRIYDSHDDSGNVALEVSGFLASGNQQSHRLIR